MSGTTGEGYRADIDGLRAIAVLSVLAFHAFPDLVPGGFTGVDIFFSISGFLITGIILQAIDADTFTFAQFYGRRIRRIFPALLAMFAVTIIAGRFVLLVREYQSLGLHVAAGSIFTSNFLLWSEAGYFDLAAHYKPLLHLWSLGVEEQFYLFWPLMLLIVPGRFGLRLIATVFLALASYYACRHIFVTDPTANFYSPLTRWWELMIGALLAQTIRLPVTASIDKIPLLGILIRNVASTAGAAMIVFGLAFIDQQQVFPGRLALLPAGGATLLIFGRYSLFNRFVLSAPPLVAIGTISYPLYLWHWPLLVFARLMSGGAPTVSEKLACLAIAFALAAATYVFIERPVRRTGLRNVPRLVYIMAAFGLFGLWTYLESGQVLGKRLDAVTAAFLTYPHAPDHDVGCDTRFPQFSTYDRCRLSKNSSPDIVLIGDSHSAQYFNALANAMPDASILNVDAQSCLPFSAHVGEQCKRQIAETYSFIENTSSIRTVILAGYWHHLIVGGFEHEILGGGVLRPFEQGPAELFSASARQLMGALLKANKQVIFVEDNPTLTFDPRSCIPRPISILQRLQTPCAIARSVYEADLKVYESTVENSIPAGVQTISIADRLCDDRRCYAMKNGRPLYWDMHHLSGYGAESVISAIVAKIAR